MFCLLLSKIRVFISSAVAFSFVFVFQFPSPGKLYLYPVIDYNDDCVIQFCFLAMSFTEMTETMSKTVFPESVLKKRKREEEWALAKKQELEAAKKQNAEKRKLIFNRAKRYSKEYQEKVLFLQV